ncbi:MAG: hypothetical protein M3460_17595 [Actinomycetota bacterium]|nr:hypothetical protein [Actinomycetota bacterium]
MPLETSDCPHKNAARAERDKRRSATVGDLESLATRVAALENRAGRP